MTLSLTNPQQTIHQPHTHHMFTIHRLVSRQLVRTLSRQSLRAHLNTSTVSAASAPAVFHQHDLRLSMNKLIKSLSVLPLPDFKKTLKKKDNLTSNADDTLRCLLILLTKRLERLSSLSFIMLMNPHMAKIWDAYLNSYNELIGFIAKYSKLDEESIYDDVIKFKFSDSIEENENFVKVLHDIMDMHTDNVVDLRDGIHEAKAGDSQNSSDETLFAGFSEKQFLDEHLSERVLMRLIANNHILLSEESPCGILDNNLNVLDILSRSVEFVNDMSNLKYYEKIDVIVNTRIIDTNGEYHLEENINLNKLQNHTKITFPYIGNHIEYVLNEILKNSARAVIENHKNVPVKILIVLDKSQSIEHPALQIKISDNGGGIRSKVLEKLWEYSFTTVNESKSTTSTKEDEIKSTRSGKDIELGAAHDLGFSTSSGSEVDGEGADSLVGDNIIAGMGYGLPLSLTYCRLFGGDIKLHTVWGHGTDVYVVLRGI